MNTHQELFSKDPADYDAEERKSILEQYKLYVEMADRISQRRQSSNGFFLTVNTALAVIAGALVSNVGGSTNPAWLVAIAAAGITLSYTWHRGIHSYRDINTAKFNIIHQIESRLPLRLYHAEWLALGEGRDPKRFLPFTSVERKVPWVFIAIYVSAVLIAIAEHTALLSAVCSPQQRL